MPGWWHTRSRAAGFTLLELLVAISIIVTLVAIGLVSGNRVLRDSKTTQTQQTLFTLNLALDVHLDDAGVIPPPVVRDPRDDPGDPEVYLPIADARNLSATSSPSALLENTRLPGSDLRGNQMINSGGLFLLQAIEFEPARAIIEGLPDDFLKVYSPDRDALRSAPDALQPEVLTPFDAWGFPIRYVHPAFDGRLVDRFDANVNDWSPSARITLQRGRAPRGVQYEERGIFEYEIENLRRGGLANPVHDQDSPQFTSESTNLLNFADSDGGVAQAGRPYFYSVGPDGKPQVYSTLNSGDQAVARIEPFDNVYTSEPRFDINPSYDPLD
ncbi:MAG: type II secretion system protein [Planctomycetota bacterium]